jgi:hypothetical protein
MASYSRPGVFINEVPLPQLVALADNGQARGAFLGAFAQGPTAEPVLIQSWYDFGKTFGSLSDSYQATWAIYSFFANGGRSAYIKRVTGSGATAASVTLRDRAGTPLSTLRVTAKSAGAWGNGLTAEVTSSSTTTFNLIISDANVILEQYTDLSMSTTNSRYAVAYVNSASYYVTLTNLTSGTAAPANMPEIAGVKAFTSGADGSAPTRGNYQTALATFDAITNPMLMINADASYAFASGGQTGDRANKVLLDNDITAYAEARGDVFALIDPPAGSTAAEAITYAIDGCGAVDGGNAAIYFPWVVIPDLLKSAPGATRVVGPAAIAAGKYLETDAARGVFKTPAGFGTKIGSAVALERTLTNAELDSLNVASKPVNAIRNVPGAGIVIMGGRTLNNSTGERYINVRRSLIFLKKEITDRSNFAVFENNSEVLWTQLRNTISTFLREYWSQGGLRGTTPEQAFYVRCDASNNTATDILNGRVNIEIGVAVEYPAEFIVISIGQITGSASA